MNKQEQSLNKQERIGLQELELAQRWGMAVTTLQKWRQQGIGPNFLKMGSRVLYPIKNIEQFEVESLRVSTSEKA